MTVFELSERRVFVEDVSGVAHRVYAGDVRPPCSWWVPSGKPTLNQPVTCLFCLVFAGLRT